MFISQENDVGEQVDQKVHVHGLSRESDTNPSFVTKALAKLTGMALSFFLIRSHLRCDFNYINDYYRQINVQTLSMFAMMQNPQIWCQTELFPKVWIDVFGKQITNSIITPVSY